MNHLVLSVDAHERAAVVGLAAGENRVLIARSGLAALRLARCSPIDLYILAFTLPDMGGPDLCRHIRAAVAQRIANAQKHLTRIAEQQTQRMKAYRAFVDAGGSRANFSRVWPEVRSGRSVPGRVS
jgi:DNA-binding response OmpR family regulator